MHLVLSHADTAYKKGCANTYFDTASISDTLPEHRRKSLIASRFLLCMAADYFYSKKIHIDFDKGEHGKPYIKSHGLFFNISHCENYIALVLSQSTECGVDIESIKDRKTINDLAKRVLGQRELEHFNLLEKPDALLFFYRMWTVRECLLKQSGLGLVGLESIRTHDNMQNISSPSNPKGNVISMHLKDDKTDDRQYLLSCFYIRHEPEMYFYDGTFKNLSSDCAKYFKINY